MYFYRDLQSLAPREHYRLQLMNYGVMQITEINNEAQRKVNSLPSNASDRDFIGYAAIISYPVERRIFL